MFRQKIFTIILTFLTCFGALSQEKFNQYDSDQQRHGPWRKYFEGTKQVRYEGTFNHGKEVGLFKFYKKLGKTSYLAATKVFDEEGIATVTFFAVGDKVISTGRMKDTIYVGEWRYFHKNSDRLMTREFHDDTGKLHGVKEIFYPSGQQAQKINFVHGKREGVELFYAENGTVVKQYFYENNQLHGKATHFNDRGEVILEGIYKRDKRTGIWTWYNNGRVIREKDYTYIPKYKSKQ